jgi:EAL domain-containing protein (putative c-di-GMP-specific phosphodiesterase class I)/CHASE2 domain-containing sensor protein
MRVRRIFWRIRSVPSGKKSKSHGGPLKVLLWTALAGLIFGLLQFGEIAEDLLRSGRNSLHWHKASGDIVLVKIDDESLRQVGRWPWPRSNHAEMTDVLTKAGAKRIFFDIGFFGATDPVDDRQFADALTRSNRVVLAVRTVTGTNSAGQRAVPLPAFGNAPVATIDWEYNWQNAVWRIPYSMEWNGRPVHSFSSLLSGQSDALNESFIPDYSIDPKSIPSVSASKVLKGQFNPGLFRGRDVVIGTDSDGIGDQYFVPGSGKMGGAYIHIIAAETLKAGIPRYLGWLPLFLASLAIAALALTRRRPSLQGVLIGGWIGALFFAPAALEMNLIFVDIMPGLFVTSIVGIILTRRLFRHRGLVNAVSGLPNLNALRANRAGRDQALIVARILNYADIVAALPTDSERQLVEQIVARLSVGSGDRTFYQGDGGIFAWFEEPRKPFGHHIDALYALFRNPVRVAKLSVDPSISFGVEIGSGRPLATRLASALVAAEEAAHDGLKWKCHDPASVEDASWRLSMLSQLDAAIDKGEVWIAFQPQLDLKSRRIIGAEALARWTHPDKGPIAATEFVAAAEQHDRIGKLTDFVLEKAAAAAAIINKRGHDFRIAVNLSARLLTDKQFVMRVTALIARHGLNPNQLTLELTETAELVDSGDSLETLNRLRDLGVEVSIDDYGTGLSTLEYLKKVPASEIKIDQSFVKGLTDNRSDRLMVHSTIGLAHSLGRKVVAEGVEQSEILDALIDMGCDVAQGYIVGRPMSLESLLKRISNDRRRVA